MNQFSETADHLRAKGLIVETVGDILGSEARPPISRFVPARLEGVPDFPEPGIYFGMDDATYHAIPALSSTGIKKLAASPMLFWAGTQWLNPKKLAAEQVERPHHTFGKAYHCRIMEGPAAYAQRYAIALDPADYPEALVSTDQIKAAIAQFTCSQPVKPQGKSAADFAAQLLTLAPHAFADETCKTFADGERATVESVKVMISKFTETVPVQPIARVPDVMPDGTEYQRSAVKEDWIAQLMGLDPEALVFANLQSAHAKTHAGKTFLSADQHAELEIAALMVERDPEIQHAFKGGYAEASLFWYCAETGVPMKARVDYLKLKAMVDLKSIANQRERSIEQAIRFEIAQYHYNVQVSVYCEAAKAVRQLVRQGVAVIHGSEEQQKWAEKWAVNSEPETFLFVFQQKGEAPITRGVWFPVAGTVNMVTGEIVRTAKRKFLKCASAFEVSPWLDVAPIYMIADEDMPQSVCEI